MVTPLQPPPNAHHSNSLSTSPGPPVYHRPPISIPGFVSLYSNTLTMILTTIIYNRRHSATKSPSTSSEPRDQVKWGVQFDLTKMQFRPMFPQEQMSSPAPPNSQLVKRHRSPKPPMKTDPAAPFVFLDRKEPPIDYIKLLRDVQICAGALVVMLGYRAFGFTYPVNGSHIFMSAFQLSGLQWATGNCEVTLDVRLPPNLKAPRSDVWFSWTCDYSPRRNLKVIKETTNRPQGEIGTLDRPYEGSTTQGQTRTIQLTYFGDRFAQIKGDSQLIFACFSTPPDGWSEENWRKELCKDFSGTISHTTVPGNSASGLIIAFKGSWRMQRSPEGPFQ